MANNKDNLDIIHLHSTYAPINNIIASVIKIPYICMPHGGYSLVSEKKSFNSRVKKMVFDILAENRLIKKAAMIHALDDNERNYIMQKFKLNLSKCTVVPNGTEIREISINNTSRVRQHLNIVFIGRIDKIHKGLDLMLQGYCQYRRHGGKKIKLTIIGPQQGSDYKELQEYYNENIGEGVTFINGLFGKEKEEFILNNTDIFIHTSRWEGLPLSVLEAIGSGVPVIVSKETNMGQYISNYNAGWVLENNNPESIEIVFFEVSKINDLTQYKNNALLLAREEFCWDEITSKVIKYYYSVQNRS